MALCWQIHKKVGKFVGILKKSFTANHFDETPQITLF